MEHLFKIREDLHRIPEPAHKEHKTCEYIFNYLSRFDDLTIHRFPFPCLVVEYNGSENEDYYLFRAEMDALPVKELTGAYFSSDNDGFMHACGHDIHLTVLIGLIEDVVKNKQKRNVLFLFQPAEEGAGGAEKVLATGIFDSFTIKEAYALHVKPNLPVGTISSCPGIIFGIPQEFDVIFRGKSAHAANPQSGSDAILAASHFMMNANVMAAKQLSPDKDRLIHIGKITGGRIRNIIADECILEGTLRVLDGMEELQKIVNRSAQLSADIFNAAAQVDYLGTYDPVKNSQELYEKLKRVLPQEIGFQEAVPALTGEDFGFFTTKYRGLLFWLGAGESYYDLHSPYFLPDEKAILTGITVFKKLLAEK